MTNILLDTNIIVAIVRAKDDKGLLKLISPDNSKIYISIVSEAEIRSLAIRNRWGSNKLRFLEGFLNGVTIVDITPVFVAIYAEIDAYSQRQNPDFERYSFNTSRNMGKNDLWIASLAALLNLRLITTDADFDHLHNVFFEVNKIDPAELSSYLN